jgi:hypothetical protein
LHQTSYNWEKGIFFSCCFASLFFLISHTGEIVSRAEIVFMMVGGGGKCVFPHLFHTVTSFSTFVVGCFDGWSQLSTNKKTYFRSRFCCCHWGTQIVVSVLRSKAQNEDYFRHTIPKHKPAVKWVNFGVNKFPNKHFKMWQAKKQTRKQNWTNKNKKLA